MGIVIRQSLKSTFVHYIGVLLGIFVQFYIVTKFLEPEVLGLTKLVYEIALLCSTFALLGSHSSSMRFFPYFRNARNGNNGFFFYYLMMPIIGTIVVSLLYCSCKTPIISFFGGENSAAFTEFFYWVIPLMIVLTFWQFFENFANINMRIAIPKAIREIGMRVLLLGSYLLYAFKIVDVAGLLFACIVSYALCLLATGIYALHIGDHSLKHDFSFITPDLRRKFLRYTGFLLLVAASGNVMTQIDLFMLSSVRGLYSGGIYTIVLYIAAVIEMPMRSITAITAPLAAQSMKNNDVLESNSLYKQVSIHQLMAAGLLFILIWSNLDNIFSIIPNGNLYAEGRYAILFLGLSKIIYSTLNFGNILISYSKYYYWTLYITLFLTILSICTNLYLIPIYGISGAALATLITSIVSYAYQQYIVQRKLRANPFSRQTGYMVLVLLILYGVDTIIPSMADISPWLDMTCRTLLLGGLSLVLMYQFKISPQITLAIDRYVLRRQ